MHSYKCISGKQIVIRVLFSIISLIFTHSAFATHNRAGEIVYKHLNGFTYQVTIITYTKTGGESDAADRPKLQISWGDGTTDSLFRSNGNGNGVEIENHIKYNEYTGVHRYPGFGTFVISMSDPNRISTIRNIPNSVNQPFFIADTLKILDPQFYGYDNSPILLNPPVDYGYAGQVYIHNPNAYDPDGDSLSFEFIVPGTAPGHDVDGYVPPNQVPGTPCCQSFTINSRTGEVVWDHPVFGASPADAGIVYNFAILIKEYRNGFEIGTMVRDMEVIILNALNRQPVLAEVRDTCIVAGSTLVLNVSATDPDAGQTVSIISNGGPYDVPSSPATFTSFSGFGRASGIFNWNTTCEHIRAPFYQVVFKAEDNYSGGPAIDLKNWLITVVAPPPQNVLVTPQGNNIIVSWQNPYSCAATARFIGFSVWRKEGSDSFIPGPCDVGLEGKGYTKLGEHLTDYQYIDQNVQRGKLYCYRVLAEFADRTAPPAGFFFNNVESLPSDESCASLRKEIPVITNVSVTVTDVVNGNMFIAWSKPNAADLDTLLNPGPYKYVIYRSVGFPGAAAMQKIDSFSAPSFYLLNDSVFNDKNLNTSDNPYSYKIVFYSNGNLIGETNTASSIYLTTSGSDNTVTLSWQLDVPWTNNYYIIYRKNAQAQYDSIGTSNSFSFSDESLANGVEHCYVVKSVGSYSAPGFVNPIINLSEEKCAMPVDTIGPCAPALTVRNTCNDQDFNIPGFVNQLLWTYADPSCADDVIKYLIYFASNSSSAFTLVDSVPDPATSSFNHVQSSTISGCYAVAGVDSFSNTGPLSNVVCVTICPTYTLPNVFTPNGDEKNDVFHPFLPIAFIDKVDMKIFDQWGTLVYQTSDPYISWTGRDIKSGKELPEAVYYYVCNVYQNGLRVLPTLNGYIHLLK